MILSICFKMFFFSNPITFLKSREVNYCQSYIKKKDTCTMSTILQHSLSTHAGEDYNIMNQSSIMLTFRPEEQIQYIPFEVINDSIAETRESFFIYLTVPMNPELYYLGTIQNAVVYIDDDEGTPVDYRV